MPDHIAVRMVELLMNSAMARLSALCLEDSHNATRTFCIGDNLNILRGAHWTKLSGEAAYTGKQI